MNVLADTLVWIDHFVSSDRELGRLLAEEELLMHPALPKAVVADFEETPFVLESRKIWGKGIGWTDAQLVASALISGCKLWSNDKRLRAVAATLGVAY